MQKENDFTKRYLAFDSPVDLGFFVEHGAAGLKRRQVFAKLFYPENLQQFLPQISAAISGVLDKLVANFKTLEETLPPGLAPEKTS
jgi:hypothetical protein